VAEIGEISPGSDPAGPGAGALATDESPFAPTPDALRSALRHVAGPLAASLGSESQALSLARTAAELGEALGTEESTGTCQLVSDVEVALSAFPEEAATLPDRAAIRLILMVAARAVLSSASP
jgi:hypothetical protein